MQLSQLKIPNKVNNKKSSNPLVKIWQAIQRQLNKNGSLQKKMNAFFEIYEKNLKVDEVRFLNSRMELVTHLCNFIPRKTIVKTPMENLLNYIDDEILLISQHPFNDSDAVEKLQKFKLNKLQERKDIYATDIKTINAMREYLESLPWMPKDISDEKISEFIRDPDKGEEEIEKGYQEWLKTQPEEESIIEQELQEEFEDWIDPDDEFFAHDAYQRDGLDQNLADENTDQLLKKLMKSEEINKLYKKLANLLHPDKLTDTTKQALVSF